MRVANVHAHAAHALIEVKRGEVLRAERLNDLLRGHPDMNEEWFRLGSPRIKRVDCEMDGGVFVYVEFDWN